MRYIRYLNFTLQSATNMHFSRQEELKQQIFQPSYAHLDKRIDMALAKLSVIKVYSEGAYSSL